METKELKIQAPKGYEIDKENSTFECIKFKPIEELLNYDQIFDPEDGVYYVDYDGVVEWRKPLGRFCSNKNIATNKNQLEKLLALNKLLNIAEYYNKLHTKIDKCYNILYDMRFKGYQVNTASAWYRNSLTGIEALFNRAEDAQAVIDNPNFREILDTIYKD